MPASNKGGGEQSAIPPQEARRIVKIHLGRRTAENAGEQMSEPPGPDPEVEWVGAGILIDDIHVLTTRVVAEAACWSSAGVGNSVLISMPEGERGLAETTIAQLGPPDSPLALALLRASQPLSSSREPVVFTTPLQYHGKRFVVSGFPEDTQEPSISEGAFLGEDQSGLAPLSDQQILGLAGFRGAPVWSPELESFVGLATSLPGAETVSCITSRMLCAFYPELRVQFRVPESDRPKVTDLAVDDPNTKFFPNGPSESNGRRLSAEILERLGNNAFRVRMTFNVLPNASTARGHFVTFLTYPNMGDEYQIIREVPPTGPVEAICNPLIPDFTIAAIADGGDTRLTLNLKPIFEAYKTRSTGPATASNASPGEKSTSSTTPSKRLPSKEQSEREDTDSALAGGYRPTYSLYASDQAPFASRRSSAPLNDALGNKAYARQLAQLVSAKLTPMPLSLGLFGDWGSGKSYFMGLLDHEIEQISKQQDDVFCRKVVQIHFNAWHYLDTNLWANLVCEIFDNLFRELIEGHQFPNEKVEKLKKQLAEESALAAEARKALEDARKARGEAEDTLALAAKKRKEQERTVATFLDDLTRVAMDAGKQQTINAQLDTLAKGFGLDRLKDSYSELETRVLEARSLGGRFRSLGLTLLSPEGRTQRLTLLALALLAPIVMACVLPWILEQWKLEISAVSRVVTAVVTLLASASAWLSKQAGRGTELLKDLESAYQSVKQARDERWKAQGPPPEQAELDKRLKEESDAQRALEEAQSKVRAIEAELRDLAPGRRLLKFLEQRAGANDYRQHLGLVSLVRRDFEKLSELLHDGNDAKAAEPPLLNRIILYIDDLDRCKSERVIAVLEAVHLLLAFPIFAVVVAVDPRWLRKSLLEHYPTLLAGARSAEGAPATQPGGALASPQDYLEKIFQVPFQLERIDKDGFAKLIGDLLPVTSRKSQAVDITNAGNIGPTPPNTPPALAPAANPRSGAGGVANSPATVLPAQTVGGPATPTPATPNPVAVAATPSPGAASVPPVIPERLQLEDWERTAIQSCHPLFRTPRSVKRLANTYCLIRTGVEAKDWKAFIGSSAVTNAQYRLPLLLLAVAAAYPGLARDWFDSLISSGGWSKAAAGMVRDPKEDSDWNRLATALKAMNAETFASFDPAQVNEWLPKVKRFSF